MDDDLKGLPVHGYRQQTGGNVSLVNENKIAEERILRMIERDVIKKDGSGILDPRWAAIAKTHFEQAFMALNRAVFKPERVKFPEDNGSA